ncbi:MAG: tyrosine-type recombinase/integrase [Sulfuricaulis sp.]|uniref:tyrosine-type recombinase/integrase n=1 Tax=Sulfuricaulis sp. TaxID=2003553 RepID=UPI0025DD3170|nr:tyrosine-type recombinase/integrase [Sulfuricaulis sp.]MCR4346494.1 tyrosine-type recombinase/integrase [Sulfuricaulis sp.]
MSRPRRSENKGLPARWRHYHGAYYYQVPPGMENRWEGKKQFKLGSTLPEAYRAWAARLQAADTKLRTIDDLLDRYSLEVVPAKAPRTQAANSEAIRRLKAVFGGVPVIDFKPIHAYQYRDKRGKLAPTSANRELEVLSHAFTKAIEWGARETHPMIEGKFRKIPTPPRMRYVEDDEIVKALSLKPRRKRGSVLAVQAYMRVKLLTGLRRGDLLRLRIGDLQADGIHVQPHKTAQTTGKRLIIEWTQALQDAVDEAKSARPVHIAPWLFCNADGECYVKDNGTANGWDSMWQRFMDRVIKETGLEQRFTEHDLRAKCASDADTLAHAQQLLAHASSATTNRIYRRKPERVKPLR